MHPQELSVVIRPDGLLLEWTDTDDTYNEPSQHFQQELYRCYHAAPETWLLFLSFSNPDLRLAPALAFWRDVTVRFAETLVHLPDLEALRDHATESSFIWLKTRKAMLPLPFWPRIRRTWAAMAPRVTCR